MCLPPRRQRHCSAKGSEDAATCSSLPGLAPLASGFEDTHRFTEYANWLIPEHVMLGRYPFIEPSRVSSRERGERQLREILQAGIDTFVCLQAELPPQAELRNAGMGGFLPYKATASLLHSALGGPPDLQEMEGLRNKYLDAYLPARRQKGPKEEPLDPLPQQARRPQLDFIHSPIVDLGVPSQQQMRDLVEQLTARLEGGRIIYAHCWGGRGRAGTLGACLLARLYGVSAEEALQRVQRAFDTRTEIANSPETQEQRRFVTNFIASL
ncbi:hypothetical protein WJX84_005659 [Apatococcus fuscideae]|uniref:Tyrosine specific protein phosphatases domain-containing protein n=1 Tax=Apatococcus fuscideae TaxID=2026836 RepID=A0AAW1TBJ3_9CHLO